MSMRKFFIALVITGVFLGILLLAGTVQNEGCLPWQEPLKHGWRRLLGRREGPDRLSLSVRVGVGASDSAPPTLQTGCGPATSQVLGGMNQTSISPPRAYCSSR